MVTNLFLRKKKIKGKEYYYLVKSTRISKDKWKKIERYIGLNPPSEKDLKKYEKEFNSIKQFISSNKDEINKLKEGYKKKIKNATKDQLIKLEDNVITKFTYDTNRIEGSSLSYKDTKMLLQEGISPKEKPLHIYEQD